VPSCVGIVDGVGAVDEDVLGSSYVHVFGNSRILFNTFFLSFTIRYCMLSLI
jgi:hypothetical protein